MSSNGLKIGVVGLGVGATAHVPAARVEGVEVVALAARDAAKVAEAADRLGVEGRYSDYDALLAHPGLDAVVIATPPPSHLDLVSKAFAAGKHVILEKPFAMTTAEAAAMRDRAAASGRTAMIAEAFRFAPARRYVKALIDQGYLGELQGISMTFFRGPTERPAPGVRQHWRSAMSTGGGFSGGPMSTFFDSVIDWFGPVKAISGRTVIAHPGAVQANGVPADADETVVANFELANGAWGSLAAGVAAPFGQGGRIQLIGTEGSLEIVQPALIATDGETVSGGRFDDGPQIRPLEVPAEYFLAPSDGDPQPSIYRPYRTMYRAFADGIAAGRSPSPNFDDAYQLQRITDALQESNRTGAWVNV